MKGGNPVNRFGKLFLAFLAAVSLTVLFPFARVAADADKTALQEARDDVAAAIAAEPTYWVDSFAAFETDLAALGGLAAVDAMLADAGALQADVDTMTSALLVLLANLVTRTTYDDVTDAYIVANNRDLDAYTERSQILYDAIVDAVKIVLFDERAGEAAMFAQLDVLAHVGDVLELLADKTALTEAIVEATSLDASDGTAYTPSSFALFRAAFAAFATDLLPAVARTVNDIVADADASVAEADAALAAIESALSLLVPRPDKTELATAYAAAVLADLSGYTPTSAAVFAAGLSAIGDVVDDLEALQADVDEAAAALANLYGALVLRADKTELERANNAAIVAYYEERDFYTTSSFAAFRAAVLAYGTYLEVNLLIADPDASQADTDAMLAAVDGALALLVFRADVDLLVVACETLSAVDRDPYTPASVALYDAALAAAWVVVADDDTDQTEADAALAALQTISSLLVEKADKSGLIAACDEGAAVRASIYSNSSFQILARLLSAAETMIADEDASQTAVDELAAAITAAIDGLSIRNSVVVIREGTETVDVDDYVTFGASAVAQYVVSDPEILAIDADGNVTGLTYGTASVTVLLVNGITEEIAFVVKAKIKTATMIYALVIPCLAAGGAFAMILWNEKTSAFFKKIRIFRKTAKH